MTTYDWDRPGDIPEWKAHRHLVIAQAPSRAAADGAPDQRVLQGAAGERLAARAGVTLEDLLDRCDSTNLNRHLRQAPRATPLLGNPALDLAGAGVATGRTRAAAAAASRLEPGEFVVPMPTRATTSVKWDYFDAEEARERAAALMEVWDLWDTVLIVGRATATCFPPFGGSKITTDWVTRPNGARTTPLLFAISHPAGTNTALNDPARMAAHRLTVEEWWRAVREG